MTTIYLNKEKAPDLLAALQDVLKPSDFTLVELPVKNGTELGANTVGLIPWFSLRPGAFIRELSIVWMAGLRRLVVVSPAEGKKPWDEPELKLPPHLRAAFDAAIGLWDKPELDALGAAIKTAQEASRWARIRILQYAEARILYDELLYKFSHGSRMDLSNQFLAPARLLLQGGVRIENSILDKWKKAWEGTGSPFVNGKTDELKKFGGETGEELAATAVRVTEALNDSKAPALADIESVMQQFTRIRETAALKTRSEVTESSGTTLQAEPVGDSIDANGCRILVVDDHAEAWRPVFDKLAKNLASEPVALQVRIDFSTDGSKVHLAAGKNGAMSFGDYDLIVLDVFLGSKRGTTILERLRRDFSQLPVLLWTTSRDEEITAEATLANGILLKKTVTWKQLENAIRTWAPYGKAMRTTTLPNPFFNHAIKSLEYRKLAVDFHEWCLKQLDSFHALDNEFFRYFTDHGGRHIVKLWELMEHALRCFLGDEQNNSLLAGNRAEREVEILGLYLAVICHELGMFPMRAGGKSGQVEDFSTLGKGYLNDVRTLHAARGMVLLEDGRKVGDSLGVYWNDKRGQELAKNLRDLNASLAMRVAVLVGYHARLFKSLKSGDFLVWKAAGADLREKLGKLNSAVVVLRRSDDAFRYAFRNLARAFNNADAKERLRRQCALFRFVDALDVTASRNPADFLVGQNKLPPKQYGENLKRELCAQAGIRNGDVYAMMRVRFPDLQTLRSIFAYVKHRELMKEKDQPLSARANALVESRDAARLTETPWKPEADLPWSEESIENRSAASLQKPLDTWLEEVWKVLVLGAGSSDFVEHLKDLGILDKNSQKPRLLFGGAEIIAASTALSVAGELLDEYRGILETELHDKIRLPKDPDSRVGNQTGFVWEGKPWNSLPSGLVTLEKVLPSDQKRKKQ